uniref:Uncharacterized protein n=1 Tax=uncultured marine virus TaxID=186617 RepID=A0A0F7L6Q2_9VIRU|nr:hypothetical protein [uncultured marine virus]
MRSFHSLMIRYLIRQSLRSVLIRCAHVTSWLRLASTAYNCFIHENDVHA